MSSCSKSWKGCLKNKKQCFNLQTLIHPMSCVNIIQEKCLRTWDMQKHSDIWTSFVMFCKAFSASQLVHKKKSALILLTFQLLYMPALESGTTWSTKVKLCSSLKLCSNINPGSCRLVTGSNLAFTGSYILSNAVHWSHSHTYVASFDLIWNTNSFPILYWLISSFKVF